jgi:hypothetical protein
LTIQNTGNIPIVNANYTIDNYPLSLPLYENLMPQKTLSLNDQSFPVSFQKGVNYDCNITVGFIDGSTFSATGSVYVLNDESPTPTATSDSQSTPSS